MMTAASALDLGRQIAAGERDPVDVAEHYLGEALGDTNAAYIQVTTERALGEARQSASRTRSGQGRGRWTASRSPGKTSSISRARPPRQARPPAGTPRPRHATPYAWPA